MNPFGGIAIVLGALAALFAGVRLLPRGAVGAETSRKLVHMGMGAVCLAFPWLFAEPWPVWLLAGLAGAAMAAVRWVPALRRTLGGVLHGVDRSSWGEVYFPFGVAAVFALSDGEPLPFVVPVALLAFADAAGALVGRRWGRWRFDTLEGTKTVEGSAAVGLTGLLCTTVPLLAAGREPSGALLLGAVMGLLCLLVEAISWRGLDNIFVPVAAFVQIRGYLGLSMAELLLRLAVLVTIAVLALRWRRGKFVDDSARLAGTLALFVIWAVGGWTWLVAPVVLLASYVRLMPTVPGGLGRHNMVAVICVGSTALLCCVGASVLRDPLWLWPYTLGLATQQAVIATVRFSQGRRHWSRLSWWALGALQAGGLHLAAFGLLDRGRTVPPLGLLLGAGIIAAADGGFVLLEKHLQRPDDLSDRWLKQIMVALAATLAGFATVTR